MKKLVKKWEKQDVVINEDTVMCPLTESETASFPVDTLTIEIKGIDAEDQIVFWESSTVDVVSRHDSTFRLMGE